MVVLDYRIGFASTVEHVLLLTFMDPSITCATPALIFLIQIVFSVLKHALTTSI